MLHEHEIISRYFTAVSRQKLTHLSIGDDAAIISIPKNHQLLLSIDTLVEGVHFFKNTSPYDLGHKTLAVSLSDMAAMGATPRWALLSLTLPRVNKKWLEQFQQGFFDLAKEFQVDLIGGDTCQGPLSLSSVVQGIIPKNKAILRSGASVGDFIFVSACLGDAAYAVSALKNKAKKINHYFIERLQKPTPRVKLGEFLRGIANSMIDVSDGLLVDLKRILNASKVGATLYSHQIPISSQLQKVCKNPLNFALNGGDDYELCFTVPKNKVQLLSKLSIPMTCIGKIEKKTGLIIRDEHDNILRIKESGYEHFKK